MEISDAIKASGAHAEARKFDLRFLAAGGFALSTFIISNDNALKIGSISVSSLAALLMCALFILEGLAKRDLVLKRHPLQGPLYLMFIWVAISLMASWLIPSKAIPVEAYSYPWAEGLNSPALRGLSFLLRLFLSVFAIEYVVTALDTRGKYLYMLNLCLLAYSAVILYGVIQILLYVGAGIRIGSVITEPFFRIGGYVGEPQTFGLLIVSMFFPVVGFLKYEVKGCWFSKTSLKVILAAAIVDLAATFSVSMIFGLLLAFAVNSGKISKKKIALTALAGAALFYLFFEILNSILVAKFLSETFSLNSRTLTWHLGYNMLSNNIFTGVGIGQSPLLTKTVSDTMNLSFDSLNFEAFRVAILNSYMEWGAETGVVGIILLFYLACKAYKLGRGRKNKASEFVRFSFGGSLFAMAVSANSFGGAFYIGCFNLALALYIAGMGVFKEK